MSDAPPVPLPFEEGLVPAYPFNDPGAPIRLYDGPVGGFACGDWPGTIELCGLPRPSVNWKVTHEDFAALNIHTPATLRLRRHALDQYVEVPRGPWSFDGHEGAVSEGWITEAVLGAPDARLARVLVHWMNLPEITGPIPLLQVTEGGRRMRLGRWRAEVDGWALTLDIRPDYSDAMEEVDRANLYVLTHVMEIRRTDGSEFGPAEVEKLIESMRVSFSFAFGRWVAPVLPVGYDAAGQIVWEVWRSPICDRAQTIGHAWLYKSRIDDLAELLRCAAQKFEADGQDGITRFQMILAVQAVEAGFLEQRLLAAAPAMENLMWANLVLSKGNAKEWYRKTAAEDKLRLLLKEASIPTGVDAAVLPALAAYAKKGSMDGPSAITRVRNRLVHPKNPHDEIYRHDGLVRDAWLLSLNFVTLLILHSIGYRGMYGDLSQVTRWAGEASPVPWADTGNLP